MKEKLENLQKLLEDIKQVQRKISIIPDDISSPIIKDNAIMHIGTVTEDLEYHIQSLETQRQKDLENGVMYRW